MNYIIWLDGMEYTGYNDGRPFSLVDAWRETEGVRNCKILSATGRVVLDNAGSMTVRHYEMPRIAKVRRTEAARRRLAFETRTCPLCGAKCWRPYPESTTWQHPVSTDCNIESWHVNYQPTPRPQRHAFETVAAGTVSV